MIAKIYPDNHPHLAEKRDPSHPVRYFDIRKLTPRECYRLMGVPEERIDTLLADGDNNIAQSAHYKLAGNSIVCHVLKHIYESLLYPTDIGGGNAQLSLFGEKRFILQRDKNAPFRMVTLCSGYDSQCLAAEMLQREHPDFRFELMAWAEYDPESRAALNRQPAVIAHNRLFPQWVDRNRGDMTACDWSDLADAGIDLLTYSTPCQSISQAGKREGLKRGSGTRSSVLWSTENAVRVMRPKVLLQENVRALINKVNLPDFREWCHVLETLGYVNFLPPEFAKPWGGEQRDKHTIAGVLNAKDYGVPQNRERVYMVSVRADILNGAHYEFPRPFPLSSCVADILDDDADHRFFLKAESVIAFLRNNETDHASGIVYLDTDHKLSNEEINTARRNVALAAH